MKSLTSIDRISGVVLPKEIFIKFVNISINRFEKLKPIQAIETYLLDSI